MEEAKDFINTSLDKLATKYLKKDTLKKVSRKNPWGSLSYADLITRAIENSPHGRLTLAEIYHWMVKNVPHFSDKGDNNSSAGWKNSIRHNLSLHTRFIRMQNDGCGKSSWWALDPNARDARATRRRQSSDRSRTRRFRNSKKSCPQRVRIREKSPSSSLYPYRTESRNVCADNESLNSYVERPINTMHMEKTPLEKNFTECFASKNTIHSFVHKSEHSSSNEIFNSIKEEHPLRNSFYTPFNNSTEQWNTLTPAYNSLECQYIDVPNSYLNETKTIESLDEIKSQDYYYSENCIRYLGVFNGSGGAIVTEHQVDCTPTSSPNSDQSSYIWLEPPELEYVGYIRKPDEICSSENLIEHGSSTLHCSVSNYSEYFERNFNPEVVNTDQEVPMLSNYFDAGHQDSSKEFNLDDKENLLREGSSFFSHNNAEIRDSLSTMNVDETEKEMADFTHVTASVTVNGTSSAVLNEPDDDVPSVSSLSHSLNEISSANSSTPTDASFPPELDQCELSEPFLECNIEEVIKMELNLDGNIEYDMEFLDESQIQS